MTSVTFGKRKAPTMQMASASYPLTRGHVSAWLYVPWFLAVFVGAYLLAALIFPAHARDRGGLNQPVRSDQTEQQRHENHRIERLNRERDHVQNDRRRLAECLNTVRVYGGNSGECFSGGR